MDSGNGTQQTISVAESLLQWYQTPTNDLETLKNLMPQQVAAEVYCVRGVNFARFFRAISSHLCSGLFSRNFWNNGPRSAAV